MNQLSYEQLMKRCRLVIQRQGVYDPHDIETIAHEALMDESAKGYENRRAKHLAIDFLRKRELEVSFHLDAPLEIQDDVVTMYDTQPFEFSNEIKTAQQANHLQMITQLVDGADERTTTIVQTFLEIDKPNVSNVAKHLGLDRKQVYRSLNRLKENLELVETNTTSFYLIA